MGLTPVPQGGVVPGVGEDRRPNTERRLRPGRTHRDTLDDVSRGTASRMPREGGIARSYVVSERSVSRIQPSSATGRQCLSSSFLSLEEGTNRRLSLGLSVRKNCSRLSNGTRRLNTRAAIAPTIAPTPTRMATARNEGNEPGTKIAYGIAKIRNAVPMLPRMRRGLIELPQRPEVPLKRLDATNRSTDSHTLKA